MHANGSLSGTTAIANSVTAGLEPASTVNKLAHIADVMADYQAAGDGATDDTAHFSSAHTAVGATGEVVIPAAAYSLATNATLASAQRFVPGAVLKIATNKTITLTGAINDTWRQIFDTSASGAVVSFTGNRNLAYVRPEWWGAVAGTDSAPVAAANDLAFAAALAAAAANFLPLVFRGGQTYYISAELKTSVLSGFTLASSMPGAMVTLQISSTVSTRSVADGVTNGTTTLTSATAAFTSADVGRAVCGIGGGIAPNTVINSVSDASTAIMSLPATDSATNVPLRIGVRSCVRFGLGTCSVSSILLHANNRANHACVFSSAALGTFDRFWCQYALNHGVRMVAKRDDGSNTNNDTNEFRNISFGENGTVYATTAVTGQYSPDHPNVAALTGASIDMTATVSGGKTVLTMNGYDINNITYLEQWAPIRVGPTGANIRFFVIDSWTRVSSTQATISCWVPDTTNSADDQPYSGTGLDFAIGCGDGYHEDTFNDNNLNQFRGGLNRGNAGYGMAFDTSYGPYVSTVQCDLVFFWTFRLGHAAGFMYMPHFDQVYTEPTGQGVHRRAFVMFNNQQTVIQSMVDGVSAAGISAGQGHCDYMPNGNLVSGYLTDVGGTVALGSNGWRNLQKVSTGDAGFPFNAVGGFYVPSFAAPRSAGITLTTALGGSIQYFDCTAGPLSVTMDATLPVGWEITIIKNDTSTNLLTISGGGCSVDGVGSYVLGAKYQSVTLKKQNGGNFVASARKPYRGSAAFTPGACAAATQISLGTVTVPGAAVGDVATVGYNQTLQATEIRGEVTSSGTVTVYQYNPTAGPITLAAGSVSVLVSKA